VKKASELIQRPFFIVNITDEAGAQVFISSPSETMDQWT
jgi:hypothetical protein